MFVVEKNAASTSTFLILSVMKGHCMFRSCVLFKLDVLSFSAYEKVLLLSWYIVVVGTCCHCAGGSYSNSFLMHSCMKNFYIAT